MWLRHRRFLYFVHFFSFMGRGKNGSVCDADLSGVIYVYMNSASTGFELKVGLESVRLSVSGLLW